MSQIEHAGIRVDKSLLDATIVRVERQIVETEKELQSGPVYREWKKAYGDRLKFGSRDQLADVIFNRLGHESTEVTATGRPKADKSVLELIDDPFVRTYLKIEPMKKSLSTNLIGIRRETVQHADGLWYVHPNNNLNTVVTFRPSSDKPNWKNFPKRNPEIAALVRPIFIPRPGRRFVEVDQKQIEAKVPACKELSADPELIRYIDDPASDMHKDQARKVDRLGADEVTKAVRGSRKTNFVFATFYGSPYYNTAKRLWDDIDRYQLKTASGVPLKDHLKSKGIAALGPCDPAADPVKGTYEYHVRKCEDELWEQFAVYREWRREQVDRYHKEGGLTMITGFAVNGPHSRTEIPNYKIQGPAYHINLWSIVRLLELLAEYRWESLVLGDIYDSIQFDAVESELDDLLCEVRTVMTRDVRRHWPWITIPLQIEVEVSEPDGSWHSCKEWLDDGERWVPK